MLGFDEHLIMYLNMIKRYTITIYIMFYYLCFEIYNIISFCSLHMEYYIYTNCSIFTSNSFGFCLSSLSNKTSYFSLLITCYFLIFLLDFTGNIRSSFIFMGLYSS